MQLLSPAFANNEVIPALYTCTGNNINPPLQIIEPPENTKSFALVVADRDATPIPWVHWFVFNIPPTIREIAEQSVPVDSIEGLANGGDPGYEGPCPQYFSGIHHYEFRLYALNSMLSIPASSTFEHAKDEIAKHLIDTATLTGIAHGQENKQHFS